MSALAVVSLAVAGLALVAAVSLAVALSRTRRSLAEMAATVQRLQDAPQPAPTTELALRPTQLEAASVVVPTPAEVRRAAMARPVVRIVALSYGLSRALRPESRDRIAAVMRREFRRRRKLRLRAGRRAARYARVEGTL
jgi:hypothetical protein